MKAAIHAVISTGSDEFFLGDRRNGASKVQLRPSEKAIREEIVPALKDALERERANDIVTGALIALAKIGDVRSEAGASELEPLIAKFLSDGNQEISETAAVALGILGDDSSVPILSDLALDLPKGRARVGNKEVGYRTRAFATYGLGLVGKRTRDNAVRQDVASILIDLLGRPDASTRDVKVAALVALGLVQLDVDVSEGPSNKQRFASSRQTEILFVEKFFEDGHNHFLVRAHAPTALARLLEGAPPDLKAGVARLLLAPLAKHSEERVEIQQACALALGQVGDADKDAVDCEIRDTLLRVAEEGRDVQSRSFALISLGQIGASPGTGEDSDKGAKACRDELLTVLTRGNANARPWAGIAIGVMERGLQDGDAPASSTAQQAVRSALSDAGAPSPMGAFAIACGIARDRDAKSVLLAKLKTAPGDEARGSIAVALGLIEARDAVADIEEILKESKYKPDLLKQAAIGLGLLGDRDLVPDLVRMLEAAKGYSSQAAIASALGFIGDTRSIDPLVKMLRRKDITDSARGFAAVALGIVADKDPLPWNSRISANIDYRANTTTLTSPESTGILDIL
ncbi:MAG TPA: HEAT repeat domain-containing protein [Planctomycetota bacterium]|nr:HEAT repeat domain-containing protein [Planctomycetota bacterium]